jgi:signal peptidase
VNDTNYSSKSNKQYILTKGDNNPADDRGIYGELQNGKLWIHQDEILGTVQGYVHLKMRQIPSKR